MGCEAIVLPRELGAWQEANLARIELRLRPAARAPEGLLGRQSRSGYELLTVKDGPQIQLFFARGGDRTDLSGIMSRVDVRRPLHLLGRYTQAMVAAMAWAPDARRIYHVGFGGGRIPMVLHHYFPELVIESTELDAGVVQVARRWFGVETDDRLRVFVEDGRAYLERQADDVEYDVILVDCFTGSGQHPYALSTREFYELTREHLMPGGVVATNLVESDPLFEAKWQTMRACFAHQWRFQTENVDVFFGSDREVTFEELATSARTVAERAAFSFPFVELVDDLTAVAPVDADALTDDDGVRVSPDDPMFTGVSRNAPCPCGSGKKFKHCHGRGDPLGPRR